MLAARLRQQQARRIPVAAQLRRSAELTEIVFVFFQLRQEPPKARFSVQATIRVLDIEGLLIYKKSTFFQIGRFKAFLSLLSSTYTTFGKNKLMTEDKYHEIAKNLSLSMMKVNARCDALETLVVLLGEAVGWPKEKTEQCLREFSGISYAHRLESVEKQMGQSFAASIDDRPLLNPSDYSDL